MSLQLLMKGDLLCLIRNRLKCSVPGRAAIGQAQIMHLYLDSSLYPRGEVLWLSKEHDHATGQGSKLYYQVSRGEMQAVLTRHRGTAELRNLVIDWLWRKDRNEPSVTPRFPAAATGRLLGLCSLTGKRRIELVWRSRQFHIGTWEC